MIRLLKFIYSEKATKFCEISTADLSYVVAVKSTVEISQNFVAFSEYMNVRNSYKTRKSTLSYIGNSEENSDPSLINLAINT